MEIIKTAKTHYEDVALLKENGGYYVKTGKSWVYPILSSTVGYTDNKKEPLTKEEGEFCFLKAISDSDMVHEAVTNG